MINIGYLIFNIVLKSSIEHFSKDDVLLVKP
jgi:hypothetical protein